MAVAAVLALVVVIVLTDRLMDETLREPTLIEGGDLTDYFVPAFAYLRESIRAGEVPLWNPYQLLGSPFVASHQPGVLYPLWWPMALLSLPLGITAFALLHLWLAGFFTWLFVRRIGVSAIPALAAALAYMLSGWVLYGPFNQAYAATLAWFPAVLWSVHRIHSDPGPSNAGLLAASVALTFLAGYSQGFLYSVQFAGLYGVFLLTSPGAHGHRIRIVAWAAAAGSVAAALCAAQLLPTWELAQGGTRGLEGLSLDEAGMAEMAARDLWDQAWGGSSLGGLPWLALPLAAVALVGRERLGHAVFFSGSLLLIADFMRGNGGFVFPVYYALPGGDLFRIPLRASFLYEFASAVLIALGTQRVMGWARKRPLAGVLAGLLIAAAVGADRYTGHGPKLLFQPLAAGEELEGPGELAAFGRSLNGASRLFIEQGYSHAPVPRRMGMIHRFGMLPDYEPLLPASYRSLFGIPKVWHGDLLLRSQTVEPALLDWFGVGYYVDAFRYPGPVSPDFLLQRVGGHVVSDDPIPIVRRDQALPRAFVAEDVMVLPDHRTVLAAMRSWKAVPKALISSTELERAGFRREELPRKSSGDVEIIGIEANRVELRAQCSRSCLVVLADLYYPGWRASVDGDEIPILRTNYLLRGVVLGPGRHDLEFAYRPTSFRLGCGVSLAGALALLALLGASRLGFGVTRSPNPPA